nr:hypothetical protein [Tanacetum cinerariifolium]
MVAYLTKSDASEGFNQVIDFLNESYIKYALTINPNIYVSCIKQFWNTIAIKQVNDVTRLQAQVDKKKVVVTEASIRESISAKRTSWNEFNSAMASAVICLSTGDLSTHTTKYTSPALTQKVFANIRRVGKGFSRVETPLFEGMLVGQEIEEGRDEEEHVEDVTAGDDAQKDVQNTQPQSHQAQPQTQPQPQPAVDFPMSLLQEALDACAALTRRVEHLEYDKVAQALEITKLKRRVKKPEKGNIVKVLKLRRIDMDHALKVQSMQEDEPTEVQEVVDVVTTAKLITEVVIAASETVTAAIAAAPSKRRKGVVIRDPEEESTTSSIIPAKTKSKDKGKGILVEEPKALKKKQQVEMDEEYARKLHAELNKDIDWDVAIDHVKLKAKEDPANVAGFRLDYFKGMSYDDIRPIFEAKFNSNVDFLLKTKERMEEEESRALQRINKTPAQRAAKRRKLDEEVEDLKRHLEIVPDEDDDVYTEATLLARKVPVMDYEIIEINNKPYYKIIRADGTHQLYIGFLNLLKNFYIEDLEALWNLVKERFSTSKPKNFSNDFLLTTLGAMFEKPDAQAQVWKNQRTIHGQAKVKSWKLLESCVRLRVEEESELSLELLRFTRQQHQEGQLE